MDISVSTYSFEKLMAAGEYTQRDCIRKAAEMGFDGVEIVELRPEEGMGREEYARLLRKTADEVNLPVTSYTFGADMLTGSGGELEAEVARVGGQLEIAAILGAPRVRHDATSGWGTGENARKTFGEALPRVAEGCRRIAALGEKLGIRTTIENHGFFCQESRRVEALFQAVDHPNFGLLADMGNFLCADENPAEAVGRLAPFVIYAHAKDFHIKSGMEPNPGEGFFRSRAGSWLRGAVIGHGVVPVRQCLTILKAAGYDGPVAIEFEGLEHPLDGIRIGLGNLRRYAAEA